MVRFPSLYRRLTALVFGRLGPRSRLRRALLRRAVLSGWASFGRRDFELNLVFYSPDAEFVVVPGLQTLGLVTPERVAQGRIEAYEKLADVWGTTEPEPANIIDLGDRVLTLGFWRVQARASGVPLEQELAQLVTLRDGLVTRDQFFFSWEEGLRAAGLEPDAIALPLPAKTGQARASAG